LQALCQTAWLHIPYGSLAKQILGYIFGCDFFFLYIWLAQKFLGNTPFSINLHGEKGESITIYYSIFSELLLTTSGLGEETMVVYSYN
jgi:hypothetical protein